ncbi:MAG: hypothetical protein BWY20_02379 [Spirochaetes bacterium ADurb.Bin215]|nr:MAG: hypothetical protein BWY20_02379 [Spirochaetes bacterium ADurb.Bin215]
MLPRTTGFWVVPQGNTRRTWVPMSGICHQPVSVVAQGDTRGSQPVTAPGAIMSQATRIRPRASGSLLSLTIPNRGSACSAVVLSRNSIIPSAFFAGSGYFFNNCSSSSFNRAIWRTPDGYISSCRFAPVSSSHSISLALRARNFAQSRMPRICSSMVCESGIMVFTPASRCACCNSTSLSKAS